MNFDFLILGTPLPPAHRHRLAGTVTVDGHPAARLVCVFDRITMILLAAKWSNPTTGVWGFTGLPEWPMQRLFVVALDNTGGFNAEIADYISQVAS